MNILTYYTWRLRFLKILKRLGFISYERASGSAIKAAKWSQESLIRVQQVAHVSSTEYFELAEKWQSYIDSLQKLPDDFYASWQKERASQNIAANSLNQILSYGAVYSTILNLFRNSKQLKICDYGCGTAILSRGLIESLDVQSYLLLDVENEVQNFVKKLFSENKNVSIQDVISYRGDEQFDFLICLDVLEHLENSSEVYQQIRKMIKPGGYFLFRAPWGGHIEHPIAAAEDFKKNAQSQFEQEFELKVHFGLCFFDGLYQKRK